jgi:type IV secretion system protein VirD4
MTPDELQKMPISSCILMIRSHNPFYCNKFPIEKHPNFRFSEDFDKANAFDKYSVKAITLEEFAAENEKRKANNPDTAEGENGDSVDDKLMESVHPPDPLPEVKSIPIEYDTYAEVEQYADNDSAADVGEDFADEAEYARYGQVSELQSLEMPEAPDHDYQKEDYDDDEVHSEFSLNGNNADVDKDFTGYDTAYDEYESIENLTDMSVEWFESAQSETSAQAIDTGFYDTTDY